jgi:hypothetical protein
MAKAYSTTIGDSPPPSDPPIATLSSDSPRIALVSAPAFCLLQRQEGSNTFQLHLSNSSFVKARSASTSAPVDMSSVPEEYHDFPDVFSKAKADKPAPHRPYDLKIDLEDGAAPPLVLGAYKIQHQNQAKYVQSSVFYSMSFSDCSFMISLLLRKISEFSFRSLYFYSLLLFQPAPLAFASVAPSSRLSQLLGSK